MVLGIVPSKAGNYSFLIIQKEAKTGLLLVASASLKCSVYHHRQIMKLVGLKAKYTYMIKEEYNTTEVLQNNSTTLL